MRRSSRVARGAWPLLGVLLLGATLPRAALAYEDKATLGVAAGYARIVSGGDVPEQGPIFGVSGSLGLGDVWTLRANLGYAFHPGDVPLSVLLLSGEVLYVLDVLEVVPFFGAGLGGIGTVYDGDVGGDLEGHLTVGIDWLAGWDWLLGLDFRAYFLPLSLAEAGVDPVYMTIQVRASLVFDL